MGVNDTCTVGWCLVGFFRVVVGRHPLTYCECEAQAAFTVGLGLFLSRFLDSPSLGSGAVFLLSPSLSHCVRDEARRQFLAVVVSLRLSFLRVPLGVSVSPSLGFFSLCPDFSRCVRDDTTRGPLDAAPSSGWNPEMGSVDASRSCASNPGRRFGIGRLVVE
eukprot:scaffold662647_cov126-Attheya_sp.AAC.1